MSMKKLYILLTSFYLASILSAQNVVWVKTAGDSSNDRASAITVDDEGHIVTAGYAKYLCNFNSNQLYDSTAYNFIAKFDMDGSNIWSKKFTPFNALALIKAIRTDSNNNIYVVGYTTPSIYPCLVKFDANGNLIWQKQIQTHNEIVGLDMDKNDNVYFWCNSTFQKISPSGVVLREMTFTYPSIINFVRVFDSNNYLLSGMYLDSLQVFDAQGNDVILHHDTNIINGQNYFVKFDSDGAFMWAENYHDGNWMISNCVVNSEDESFYLLGNSDSSYLEHFTSIGQRLWSRKHYAEIGSATCVWYPYNLILKNSHIFITGGNFTSYYTNPPITTGCLKILRIDTLGNLVDIISAPNDTSFYLTGIDSYIYGNSLLVAGTVSGSGTWSGVPITSYSLRSDIMLARIDAPDFVLNSSSLESTGKLTFSVYPNPGSNYIYIQTSDEFPSCKAVIYTFTGSIAREEVLNGGKINSVNISSLPSGHYFIRLILVDDVLSSHLCIVR